MNSKNRNSKPNSDVALLETGVSNARNVVHYMFSEGSSRCLERLLLDRRKNKDECRVIFLVDEYLSFILVKNPANSTCSLYINGKLDAVVEYDPSVDYESSPRWEIGSKSYSGNPREFFTGQIDDVRIYNRALSEAEVKALYEFEKPKTQQASTPTPPAVATPVKIPDISFQPCFPSIFLVCIA